MTAILDKSNTYYIDDDISVFEVKVNQSVPGHKHNFLEIAYVKSGRVWHCANGQKQLLHKGNYVIVDYGTTHTYENITNQQSEIINCLFKPQLIDKSLKNCNSLNQVLSNYLITFDFLLSKKDTIYIFMDEGEVLALLNKINRELSVKNPGYVQIIRAYLIELIIITMRKYQAIHRELFQTKNIRSIDHIIQYINCNYEKQIPLPFLANEIHMSISHLSRVFKRITGYSLSEYVQRVRIKQACSLLSNTNKRVSEIAISVGYCDYKFFNEVFKRIMGQTPLQFRKR